MKKKYLTTDLKLDQNQSQLINSKTGKKKRIEPRLSSILSMLLEARGQVVERNQIINKIWGNYDSGEKLLTHSIAMLRKEVGSELIKTIPKKGYMIEEINRSWRFQSVFQFKHYYYWIGIFITWCVMRIFIFPHH